MATQTTSSALHKVSIKPEEDVRLPILEAEIDRKWRQYRPAYVKMLQKTNDLQSQVSATAMQCLLVLHQAEERGLGPDQGRELIQDLMLPQH